MTNAEIIEKIIQIKEYELRPYADDRDYQRLCDIAWVDYNDTDDFVDEDGLIDRCREYIEEGELFMIRNLLRDIDLTSLFWRVNSNGRPVDVDKADCEYLKWELIDRLKDELDEDWLEELNNLD